MEMEATSHVIYEGDARDLSALPDESVHLVLTSPPYAHLKRYEEHPAQLGHIEDYEAFLDELDKSWAECHRVLVTGGRIACVVGDVCISRRRGGRHYVLPLSADIQVRGRHLGFDSLTPIRWLKVANIKLEASNSARFLGKPNLPNGVIKNDIEHILFLRKPGGYRKPTPEMEARSDFHRQAGSRQHLNLHRADQRQRFQSPQTNHGTPPCQTSLNDERRSRSLNDSPIYPSRTRKRTTASSYSTVRTIRWRAQRATTKCVV